MSTKPIKDNSKFAGKFRGMSDIQKIQLKKKLEREYDEKQKRIEQSQRPLTDAERDERWKKYFLSLSPEKQDEVIADLENIQEKQKPVYGESIIMRVMRAWHLDKAFKLMDKKRLENLGYKEEDQ